MQSRRPLRNGPPSANPSYAGHARSPSASSASSTSSYSTFASTHNNASSSTIKLVTPSTPSTPTSTARTPTAIHSSPGAPGAQRPGYFEPSLHGGGQGVQQVAAAYAMQASQRKRSATDPSDSATPLSMSIMSTANAAASAAFPPPASFNAGAYGSGSSNTSPPRTMHPSPPQVGHALQPPASAPPAQTKKESSKMKLFSKPARIATPVDKALRPPPSPNKISHPHISSPIPRLAASASSTALGAGGVDIRRPSYSSSASAAATLVGSVGIGLDGMSGGYSSSPPPTAFKTEKEGKEKDKEKDHHSHSHKPHFLRPRRDKEHGVTLSSSASNSKAVSTDGGGLYSFGPSSPSSTVFGVGGKEGRELQKSISGVDITGSGAEGKKSKGFKGGSYEEEGVMAGLMAAQEGGWNIVRGHVLGLFEGEPLRVVVEDLNKLVGMHIKRAHDRRNAAMLLDDVRDLLDTGMSSLDPSLPTLPDERLIPRLVELWTLVFGYTLPYLEAVFLPLQMEFKGLGPIMSARESRDFFAPFTAAPPPPLSHFHHPTSSSSTTATTTGNNPSSPSSSPQQQPPPPQSSHQQHQQQQQQQQPPPPTSSSSSAPAPPPSSHSQASVNSLHLTLSHQSQHSHHSYSASASASASGGLPSNAGAHLDTRRLILLSFRDCVILPLYARLRVLFSRFHTDFEGVGSAREATDTVSRMLQCVSVLAGVLTRDENQALLDELSKSLKHNWLSRGRTGRNRRGFVGTRAVRVGV